MSDDLHVSKHETGVTRVFALDLDKEHLASFMHETYGEDGDDYSWPLQTALGAEYLDHDFIEAFPMSDLGEMGLADYLAHGHGVAEDELDAVRASLESQTRAVVIISSSAFRGIEQHLDPTPPLKLLAVFREEPAIPPMDTLASKGAVGNLSAPNVEGENKPRRRPGSLVALVVLILIVVAFAWLGGGE